MCECECGCEKLAGGAVNIWRWLHGCYDEHSGKKFLLTMGLYLVFGIGLIILLNEITGTP